MDAETIWEMIEILLMALQEGDDSLALNQIRALKLYQLASPDAMKTVRQDIRDLIRHYSQTPSKENPDNG